MRTADGQKKQKPKQTLMEQWSLLQNSGGSRGGARGPPLFWQKKKKLKNAEARKAVRASDIRKSILFQHLKKTGPRLAQGLDPPLQN